MIKVSNAIMSDVKAAVLAGEAILVETKRYVIEVPQCEIDGFIDMFGEDELPSFADSVCDCIVDNIEYVYSAK